MSSDRLLFRSQSDEESFVGTPISKSPSLASIPEGSTRKESYSSLASYSTGGAEDGSRDRKHFGESIYFPLLAPIRSYFTEQRFVSSQTRGSNLQRKHTNHRHRRHNVCPGRERCQQLFKFVCVHVLILPEFGRHHDIHKFTHRLWLSKL